MSWLPEIKIQSCSRGTTINGFVHTDQMQHCSRAIPGCDRTAAVALETVGLLLRKGVGLNGLEMRFAGNAQGRVMDRPRLGTCENE